MLSARISFCLIFFIFVGESSAETCGYAQSKNVSSPACVRNIENPSPHKLPMLKQERLERKIIAKNWRVIGPALPLLSSAKTEEVIAWADPPEFNRTLNQSTESIHQLDKKSEQCEVLRKDLIAGNYSLPQRPDFSLIRDGIVAYRHVIQEAASACDPNKILPDDNYEKYNMGDRWLFRSKHGIVKINFDVGNRSYWINIISELCNIIAMLPESFESHDPDGKNRTKSLSTVLLKIKETNDLVALQYLEVVGYGAGINRGDSYGDSLEPSYSFDSKLYFGKILNGKLINRSDLIKNHFISAYIITPSWDENNIDIGDYVKKALREKPCVWQLEK